jgi:hypothetical protein
MPDRFLSDEDVAGAIYQLAQATGHGQIRNLGLTFEQQTEVMRLTSGNPMFRQDESAAAPVSADLDLSDGFTAQSEVLRLTAASPELFGGGRPSTFGGNPQRWRGDAQTVALSADGGLSGTDPRIVTALRVRGLPADALAGSSDPISDLTRMDQAARRAALARTLPSLVVDSDEDGDDGPTTGGDNGGTFEGPYDTGGLSDDDEQDLDSGDGTGYLPDDWGKEQGVVSGDGARFEVSRIVRTYAGQVSGLQAGGRARHPQTGKFVARPGSGPTTLSMPAAVR